jgi:hypothetical protein
MSFDDALKLLFFVPPPLRRPVALAILALPGLAWAVSAYETFAYEEAFESPLWLAAVSLSSLILLVLAWRRRGTLGRRDTAVWSVLFVVLLAASAVAAYLRYPYVYNELGFYHSRCWSKSEARPDAQHDEWEWRIVADKDLSQVTLLIRLENAKGCSVVDFRPTVASPEYKPTITDVSPEPDRSTAWRVAGLRRPAEILFHLVTPRRAAAPACRPRVSSEGS